MSLSLCMIVKNEEQKIAKAIESVLGLVDQIVIVDTGSLDKTKLIAKNFGADLYDFEWVNDFSLARNYSISKATKDWILFLDADEWLKVEDYKNILSALNDANFDAYAFNWCHIHYPKLVIPLFKIRLFRRKVGIKFFGRVHEDILPSLDENRWKLLNIDLIHEMKEVNNQKIDNYISLLNKEILDNPTNSRTHCIIGLHYSQKGNLKDAKYHFLKSIDLKNRPYFIILSALQLAKMSFSTPKEAISFLDLCSEVINNNPDDPEILTLSEIPIFLKKLKEILFNVESVYSNFNQFLSENQW